MLMPWTTAVLSRPTILISYRRETPTIEVARKLFTALRPPAQVWKADVFMNEQEVESTHDARRKGPFWG